MPNDIAQFHRKRVTNSEFNFCFDTRFYEEQLCSF